MTTQSEQLTAQLTAQLTEQLTEQQNFMPANRVMLALIALLGGFVFTACEDTVAPDDIPYVERMVVYGVITAGKPADSIRFSRTLPLNTLYQPADGELTDVVAAIESGGKSYPLRHIGRGFYNAEGLIPEDSRSRRTLHPARNVERVGDSCQHKHPASAGSGFGGDGGGGEFADGHCHA